MIDPRELLAQQRSALIALDLAQGARLTTREVAERTGLGYCGAYLMLSKLSAILPIYCEAGQWGMLEFGVQMRRSVD
jgi:hypothetical protein